MPLRVEQRDPIELAKNDQLTMPRVSVIMPAYNQERFVGAAIASVLAQTFVDYELILIDDGSTDGTGEIVHSFAWDKRIVPVSQENRGVSAARNRGLEMARGHYAAFLDADDLWDPGWLTKAVGVLNHKPTACGVVGSWRYIDASGSALPQATNIIAPATIEMPQLLLGNPISPSSVVVRLESARLAGGFPETFAVGEDTYLWLRMIHNGCRFVPIDSPQGYVRKHDANTMLNLEKSRSDLVRLVHNLFSAEDALVPVEFRGLMNSALSRVYLHTCRLALRQERPEIAREDFRKAVANDPEILTSLGFWYSIACAGQPPGYEGTRHNIDLSQIEQWIEMFLQEVESFQVESHQTMSHLKAVKVTAYTAVGRLAYSTTNDARTTRRFLLRAICHSSATRQRYDLFGYLLRSLVGRSALTKAKRLRARASLFRSMGVTLLAFLVFFVCLYVPVQAQQEASWTPPAVLHEPTESRSSPFPGGALVTDRTGAAHFAWLSNPAIDGSQDLILYSRWDGTRWLGPIDIFAAHGALRLGVPELLTTPDDQIHMFWIAGTSLVHSQAQITAEMSARAWTSPEAILELEVAAARLFDIALDIQGNLHVIYTEDRGGIYHAYTSYPNKGYTWERPQAIQMANAQAAAWAPRISVAPNGRVHAVWSEFEIENGADRVTGLYHAYADSPELTWSESVQIAGFGNSVGNILAVDDRMVYIAWNGGIAAGGGRFFRRSVDGGKTWDPLVEVSKGIGLTNSPSIALDGNGNLHLLMGDSEYIMWNGVYWLPGLRLAYSDVPTQRAWMTLLDDEQLLAVWAQDDGVINYAIKQQDFTAPPAKQPAGLATEEPLTFAPGGAKTAPVPTATAITVMMNSDALPASRTSQAGSLAILLSFAVSMALVVTVVVLHVSRRHH